MLNLTILLATLRDVGIPVAMEKLEGPATSLVFLGIEVDMVEMVLRLPPGKLKELQELAEKWLGRKSCSHQELQSVAGKLQHACKVVRPGRRFLRRVSELMRVWQKRNNTMSG